MITGNGPPRSGWLMKVAVWPSLVEISICWSIMGRLSRSAVFLGFPQGLLIWRSGTIARKPQADKALAPSKKGPALNRAAGIAIVCLVAFRAAPEILGMTQTNNRF